MQGKKLGLVFFVLGVLFIHLYTTVPFLWALLGISLAYPLTVAKEVPSTLPGFAPIIGGVLLVVGSLIYGQKVKEVIK